MTTILSIISNLLSLLRWLADVVSAAESKQAGRDEISARVNKEAADAQDRMAKVPDNPSDDDIARRMSDGSFLVGRKDNLPNDTAIRQGDTRHGACRIPTFAKWFKD